jgi:predicted dehydrogenase
MDLAPHGLDLTDFLLDDPVEEVAAFTQRRVQDYAVDDGAIIMGRTHAGTLLSLHVAYNCPDALPRRRLEVLGSDGIIIAENTMGQDPGGHVTLIGADGARRALDVPDADASPFARQMAAFARAVVGDRGGFSAERDLHTMRLLHRAYAMDPRCP